MREIHKRLLYFVCTTSILSQMTNLQQFRLETPMKWTLLRREEVVGVKKHLLRGELSLLVWVQLHPAAAVGFPDESEIKGCATVSLPRAPQWCSQWCNHQGGEFSLQCWWSSQGYQNKKSRHESLLSSLWATGGSRRSKGTYLAHGLILRARPLLMQNPAPPVANQNFVVV